MTRMFQTFRAGKPKVAILRLFPKGNHSQMHAFKLSYCLAITSFSDQSV